MTQKITLSANGIVQSKRMKLPNVKGAARQTPAIKLSRLHQLLRTKRPRICVVRGEGIGDVITATPTIRGIKEMFEDSEITFATNTRYLGGALVKVLQHNPDIDHIIERDLMDDLVFDLIVNLHCPAIALEKQGVNPGSRIDIFARHAGVGLKDGRPRFYVQKEEIEAGEILLQSISPNDKVVLVQPFSSAQQRGQRIHTKIKQALINLNQDHGVKSVIITHSSDGPSDVLWDNIPGSLCLRDLDIRGIAGVAVHCDLILCPDSSVMHLAGALGVPTVALFGPTPPDSRLKWYPNIQPIWEGRDIPACPCWYGHCPTGYTCWERVNPPQIVETCIRQLNSTNKIDIVNLLEGIKPLQIKTEII